jgi:hypothetical protein
MTQQKDIIFYSNFCKYSQDLLKYIVKQDLKKMFVFVCVEKNRQRIPPQVDKVPALFLTNERRVLFEDDIIECIQSSVINIAPSEQPCSSFSDTFSILEDDTMMPNQSVDSKRFSIFGQEQRIHTPEEDTGNKNDNELSLERYNSMRESDITQIFGSGGPRRTG